MRLLFVLTVIALTVGYSYAIKCFACDDAGACAKSGDEWKPTLTVEENCKQCYKFVNPSSNKVKRGCLPTKVDEIKEDKDDGTYHYCDDKELCNGAGGVVFSLVTMIAALMAAALI